MIDTILFLGDVVGRPGRKVLEEGLGALQDVHKPLFTVVNGENAAAGHGISPSIADEMFAQGVDIITLGNHAFNRREIYPYLGTGKPIVRPANLPAAAPGRGLATVERDGVSLTAINLCGRVFLDGYDDPFRVADELLSTVDSRYILVDFHAEATSEKIAMGLHLDGRATAVVGTHTHVPTADEQILDGGTAYITDVGMTGPRRSVIGMDREAVLRRFRTSMPERFEVANEPGVISGVVIGVQRDSGRAVSIERVRFGDDL